MKSLVLLLLLLTVTLVLLPLISTLLGEDEFIPSRSFSDEMLFRCSDIFMAIGFEIEFGFVGDALRTMLSLDTLLIITPS
mmetsp:Transcript_16622/g.21260  ORF Transcript_16622/g.21260 Transcript_16622/m.21260 type:complete len:80 (-) Transcript_16622:431-670(-)